MNQVFPGVFRIGRDIATENSTRGFRVYDERLVKKGGQEYRIWDPHRSKLGAAIQNRLKRLPIDRHTNVLYLGASTGTTASHVADITDGFVYCVEFSKRMERELMPVCEKKKNMIPILADAKNPKTYMHAIQQVDIIFQDVAQPNQAEILIRNAQVFCPKYAMLSIKSRSINTAKNPKQVFREEIERLKPVFEVLQIVDLAPYEKDHVLVNLKMKGK